MKLFSKPAALSRDRVEELKLEALRARNERRQRDAKAALDRRGVTPRVVIGRGHVPQSVARTYTHMNVRGLA
ncbi:hypothetical protein QCE62_07080 [Caballeronia sp. LZ033]|uniref:hypothetical protein n=1 Tax=Caballeronia sp. LZ033 TaxID=3038566 RepID=UPI00285E24A1|nr:hypothetical protein [Caballeronia sp. LZ033]MDR5813355.1 hypothetical protein [Caballeronia sp. LZ033]